MSLDADGADTAGLQAFGRCGFGLAVGLVASVVMPLCANIAERMETP